MSPGNISCPDTEPPHFPTVTSLGWSAIQVDLLLGAWRRTSRDAVAYNEAQIFRGCGGPASAEQPVVHAPLSLHFLGART